MTDELKNPSYREPARKSDQPSNIMTVGVSIHYFLREPSQLTGPAKQLTIKENIKYDVRSENEIMDEWFANHPGRRPSGVPLMNFSIEYARRRAKTLDSLQTSFISLHVDGEDIIVNTALISHVRFNIDP